MLIIRLVKSISQLIYKKCIPISSRTGYYYGGEGEDCSAAIRIQIHEMVDRVEIDQ